MINTIDKKNVMRDEFGLKILTEMYGNIEPINYKFKTSYLTKMPTKLSVSKINFSKISTLSKIKSKKTHKKQKEQGIKSEKP